MKKIYQLNVLPAAITAQLTAQHPGATFTHFYMVKKGKSTKYGCNVRNGAAIIANPEISL